MSASARGSMITSKVIAMSETQAVFGSRQMPRRVVCLVLIPFATTLQRWRRDLVGVVTPPSLGDVSRHQLACKCDWFQDR